MRARQGLLCLIVTAALLAVAGLPASWAAQAEPVCASDPSGDAGPGNTGPVTERVRRADLVELCAVWADGGLIVRVRTLEPVDPRTDAGWTTTAPNAARLDVSLTLDDMAGYDVALHYQGVGGTLRAESTTDGCTGTADFDDPWYVVTFHPSCLGTVGAVGFTGYLTYPESPGEAYDAWYYDFLNELGGPVAPGGRVRDTGRIAGQTRVETAIAIARHQFPNGAPVVYLARADDPADAVVGGTLTDGPVLLVARCGPLPAAVLTEIARVDPERVLALGGRDAICDEVLAQAAAA